MEQELKERERKEWDGMGLSEKGGEVRSMERKGNEL